nr:zinc finger protein RFP-like isoform X2 [Chelonoidis abingdonii]
MAAAGNPLKSLRDEATCSICLSFFTDPVTIDCGHNFCRACIAQCWERPDTDISCPQCRETFRQRTLRPNRQLGNLAEIAKQLSVPAAAAAAAGGLCNAHQEPFKLFCNQDQVLICVICRESQAHRAHRVVPIEEAAREHKEQIQIQLNTLKQEREELLEWKQDGETQSQEYLGKIEAERQKIVSEFEQLRQFLEEQERLLLAQLEELDKEIVKIQDEYVTKLSEEISRLSDLISEIEEKCQQPTSEFLQDIRSTWSRCEKLKSEKPVAVPEDLRERVGVSSQRNVCLQEALKKFKETLPYQLNFLISKAEKEAQAIPDPDLANPCSIVSTDESVLQKYQDTGYLVPQNRFYPAPCVLGCTGFTSGRCYWEVEEKIQVHLKALREEQEKLLGVKATGEGKSQEYLKQTQTERRKIVSEFQQLPQFLEEQERLLLAQLEKLDEEIVRFQNENVSKLSQRISHLSELVSELEEKCQKPASEFLQDIRSILSRCEKGKFQESEKISPELEEQVSGFSQKTIVLLEALRKFKDTLPSALETKRGESLGAHRQANVTLDPDTAHPQLVLSGDRKSVRWGHIRQDLPNNPERFDPEPCVLGSERFTSGRHCWEVVVGDGPYWAAGVARESVSRKGGISHSPEGGIWAVERDWSQFRALTSPATLLPLSRVPSRIRVCLDCYQGQVTFIDADDEVPIFTFPLGSVPGERIRPWLWVWRARLSLCP